MLICSSLKDAKVEAMNYVANTSREKVSTGSHRTFSSVHSVYARIKSLFLLVSLGCFQLGQDVRVLEAILKKVILGILRLVATSPSCFDNLLSKGSSRTSYVQEENQSM